MTNLLVEIIGIFKWLIIIRCVLSFFPDIKNDITDVITKATDPVLIPVRDLLMKNMNTGLDFSPIIVFVLLDFLQSALLK